MILWFLFRHAAHSFLLTRTYILEKIFVFTHLCIGITFKVHTVAQKDLMFTGILNPQSI